MKPAKPASTTMNEQTFVPNSMRALYYTLAPKDDTGRTTSAPEPQLVFDTNFPTPQPSSRQYLLKIQTAAFSLDELRLGTIFNATKTTPQIPLHAICGTVISTATEHHTRESGPRFQIGDVVFGLLSYARDGGAADYALATEEELARKPPNISAAEAAALAVPALTAWQALFRFAGLTPFGERNGNGDGRYSQPLRVLVTNTRGSEVGRVAVQLLRSRRLFPSAARPWVCVCCTTADPEIISREWDVDEVLTIPHLFPQDNSDLTMIFQDRHWAPVDILLDCDGLGGSLQTCAPSVVKDEGIVLTTADERLVRKAMAAAEQDSLEQAHRALPAHFVSVNPDGEVMAKIGGLVEEHEVRGKVDRVLDLVYARDFLAAEATDKGCVGRGGMTVVRVN